MRERAADRIPGAPRSFWAKRVAAAYFRIMGMTQAEAGKAVGRAARTIRDWEADREGWELARKEAEHQWLLDVKDVARRSVYKNIKDGDAYMGLTILERVDQALSPKAQPAQNVNVNIEVDDPRYRIRQRVDTISTRHATGDVN